MQPFEGYIEEIWKMHTDSQAANLSQVAAGQMLGPPFESDKTLAELGLQDGCMCVYTCNGWGDAVM